MNSKHRTQEEIVADILSVVTKEPKKTHIMFGANLSYQLLCKYLSRLMDSDLIRHREYDGVYELTDKGQIYLREYSEYRDLENTLENTMSAFNQKKKVLNKILDF